VQSGEERAEGVQVTQAKAAPEFGACNVFNEGTLGYLF
jgi:hypothetical protein